MMYSCVYVLSQDLPGQRNRKQTKIFDPHSNQDDDEDSNANLAGRAAKYKRVRKGA